MQTDSTQAAHELGDASFYLHDYHFRRGGLFMWMLLGILVVGALGGVCMAALRNVSGDVGGGMGRDYMEKEWGITENKKE